MEERDDRFLEEVAVSLRAPVQPGSGFEARVMASVRAGANDGVLRWITRPRFVRLSPLAGLAAGLQGVSVPGEAATLSAEETVAAAHGVGIAATPSGDFAEAVARIVAIAPDCRILICGSLYLAGRVLRENG